MSCLYRLAARNLLLAGLAKVIKFHRGKKMFTCIVVYEIRKALKVVGHFQRLREDCCLLFHATGRRQQVFRFVGTHLQVYTVLRQRR